jgi:hypothetical protein
LLLSFGEASLILVRWGVSLAVVVLCSGAVLGVMDQAYNVYGRHVPLRNRLAIGMGMMVGGIGLATAVFGPTYFALTPTIGPRLLLVSLAAAGVALFFVKPLRPAAYGVAFGLVGAAVVEALFEPLLISGAPIPAGLLTTVWVVGFTTGAVSGTAIGFAAWSGTANPFDWEPIKASSLRRTKSALSALAEFVTPLRGKAVLIAVIGLGLACIAGVFLKMTTVAWALLALGITPLGLYMLALVSVRFLGVVARYMLPLFVSILAWGDVTRGLLRATSRTPLVLSRFPRAICDECLRWSSPLQSDFRVGVRHCERCGGVVSLGRPGRLVATLSETDSNADVPERIFLRSSEALVQRDRPVDVTHIRIPKGLTIYRGLENITVMLISRVPTDGLASVKVYSEIPVDELPAYTRNLIGNHFSWYAFDPLTVGVLPEEQSHKIRDLFQALKKSSPTHDEPISRMAEPVGVGAGSSHGAAPPPPPPPPYG